MRAFSLPILWILVLAIEVAALATTPRIPYSDDLQDELRGESAAFARYAAFQRDYGRDDDAILVLFEAADFAHAASQETAAEFLIELQFLPNVEAVLSPFLFSVPTEAGTTPLFSRDLSPAAQRTRLLVARAEQPGLAGMLSADLSTMQAVVLTDDLPADTRARGGILTQYRDLATRLSAEAPVTVTLTGFPLIADAVSRRLDRDTAVLNTLGVVVGLAVAWIALRSLVQALVISLVAHTTRLWTIAALHPLGCEINAVSITLPTLIVVLAFSEAIHPAMAARRTFHDGQPHPLWRALRHVWPAAALAALTTSGAFATLHLGPSEMVGDLAFFGSFAILVSTPLTLGLFCLLTVTLGRFTDPGHILHPLPPDDARARAFAPLERLATRRAGALSLSAVAVVCVSTSGYLALEPTCACSTGSTSANRRCARCAGSRPRSARSPISCSNIRSRRPRRWPARHECCGTFRLGGRPPD